MVCKHVHQKFAEQVLKRCNRQEYRKLNIKLRRTAEKAREQWWGEQCKELKEMEGSGNATKCRKT